MRRLARFTAISGISTVIKTATLLVRTKVFALVLGTAGVGVLSQLLSLESLLSTLATVGIGYGITNLVARRNQKDDGALESGIIIRTGQMLAALLSVLGMLILIIASRSISQLIIGSPRYEALFSILGAMLPVRYVGSVFLAGLQGIKDISAMAVVRTAAAVLGLVVVIPLTIAFGLPGAVWGVAAWHLFALVTSSLLLHKSMPALRSVRLMLIRWAYIPHMLRFGLANVAVVLVNSLTIITLRTRLIHLFDPAANGTYQVAWAMSTQYMTIVSVSLWSYAYPLITESLDNIETLKVEMERILRVGLLLLGPMIYLITSFRDVIIRLLYSQSFSAAVEFIPIQVWGDFLRLILWWYELPLYARGELRKIVAIELGWNALFLASGFAAMPQLAGKGLSLAYSISSALIVLILLVTQSRGMDYRRGGRQRLLVIQVMLLVLVSVVMTGSFVLRFAVSILLAPIWLYWVLSQREKNFLLARVKKFIPGRLFS